MATIIISNNTGAIYSGSVSAGLREVNSTNNYYNDTSQPFYFQASSWGSGDRGHILLKFTGLTNVSSGGIVSNGKIRLKVRSVPGNPSTTYIYRLLTSWVENQATWNVKSTGVNWGAAGALGAGDKSSTLMASKAVTSADDGTYVEFTGSLVDAYIQDAIDNPSTDYGIYIQNSNDISYNGQAVNYWATWPAVTNGNRPELVFDYATSSGTTLSPAQSSLTFTGYAPNVNRTANLAISPANSALTISTYAPVVARTANKNIQPTQAILSFTAYTPSVNRTENIHLQPSFASYALSTYAPIIVRTANQTLSPSASTLLLAGYTPSINQGGSITLQPNNAQIVFSQYVPSISQGGNKVLAPNNAVITFTTYSPLVLRTANQIISPLTAEFTLTGYSPNVIVGLRLNPQTASIVFTGYNPTVIRTTTGIVYGKIDWYYAKPRNNIYVAKPRNYNHIGQ